MDSFCCPRPFPTLEAQGYIQDEELQCRRSSRAFATVVHHHITIFVFSSSSSSSRPYSWSTLFGCMLVDRSRPRPALRCCGLDPRLDLTLHSRGFQGIRV